MVGPGQLEVGLWGLGGAELGQEGREGLLQLGGGALGLGVGLGVAAAEHLLGLDLAEVSPSAAIGEGLAGPLGSGDLELDQARASSLEGGFDLIAEPWGGALDGDSDLEEGRAWVGSSGSRGGRAVRHGRTSARGAGPSAGSRISSTGRGTGKASWEVRAPPWNSRSRHSWT